jgi:uncharacterized protein RhaS with RHS repeats
MTSYEYSVGDRVRGDDGCGGRVTFADPTSGGVVRWDDDNEETNYTWDELGNLLPATDPDDEPPGAGADPYGRPDPLTHPEFWVE